MAKDKIISLLKEAYELAINNGYGDIFYNEQYLELLISDELGHTWHPGTGPDAYDGDQLVEYKTQRIDSTCTEFKFHWVTYNKLEKLKKYSDVYFVFRDGAELLEIYKMPMSYILEKLNKRKPELKYKRHINTGVSRKKVRELGIKIK